MSTIKFISDTDTHITPMGEPTTTEMLDLWVDNEEGHRLLTYGDRPIKGASPAHDHGHNGGVVVSWPLAQGSFRSVRQSGAGCAGILIGKRQEGDTGPDTPKRLVVIPLFVPGGVLSVRVQVSVTAAVMGVSSLLASIGSFSHSNLGYSEAGTTEPVRGTLTGTGPAPIRILLGDLDLSGVGDTTEDRELELVLFQNASATTTADQLLSSYLVTALTFSRGRRATQADFPQAVVQPGDVLGGALTPELVARIKAEENQRAISLLGRAPGLTPDLSPDLTRSYIQDVYYPHSHQGVMVPDGFGGFFSDGRIIRRGWGHALITSVDERSDGTVPSTPAKGMLVHPDGDLSTSWIQLIRRIPIAAGCPSLDLRFALSPGTSDQRVRCSAGIAIFAALDRAYSDDEPTNDLGDLSNLPLLGMSTGTRDRATLVDPGFNFFTIEVDPVDNPLWVPNRERREDAGLWTRAALRSGTDAPELMEPTSAYRVSQLISLQLSHPFLRPRDTPHATRDYIVVFRPIVQTLDSGGYDAAARLLWWQITPRDME